MDTERSATPSIWRGPMKAYPELLLDKSMRLSGAGQLFLALAAAGLCALLLVAPGGRDGRVQLAAGLVALAALSVLVLYFRGPLAAARLFVGVGWLGVTAFGFLGAPIPGMHLAGYPLLLLLAGWMLGPAWCVTLFAASSVAVLLMASGQAARLPAPGSAAAAHVAAEAVILLLVMSATSLATLYLVRVFALRYADLREVNSQSLVDAQVAQAREAEMRTLTEHLPGLVFQCDAQGRCIFANQRLARFFGKTTQTLLGTPMVELLGGGSRRDIATYQAAVLRGEVVEFDMRRLAPDGVWCHVEVTLVPRQAADGQRVAGWYGMVYDVTRRERAALALRDKATHDPLTGLPNRMLFEERLQHALRNAYRQKKSVAVMFVDLDNFKRINDVMGHAAGDAFLREMARRLTGVIRSTDMVARLGGDEFVVLAEEIESPDGAAMLAEKVLGVLMQPLQIGSEQVAAGGSIGIALAPQDGDTSDALLQAADVALYEAKAAGRKCYRLFGTTIGAPETSGFSRPAAL
jgi:diguanylate cyclase (GGDEF)-like protein/PAS domain S-box-containing protein